MKGPNFVKSTCKGVQIQFLNSNLEGCSQNLVILVRIASGSLVERYQNIIVQRDLPRNVWNIMHYIFVFVVKLIRLIVNIFRPS